MELKARFDEQSNLDSGERLEAAGVNVLYSMPGLKVHAKLLLVERRERGSLRRYAWLGTGNFNESTARVYADHGLFTMDPQLTGEVREVFDYLAERRTGAGGEIQLTDAMERMIGGKPLHGTVVGVLALNVPGLHAHQREFNDGTDLNDIMPGREGGNASNSLTDALGQAQAISPENSATRLARAISIRFA